MDEVELYKPGAPHTINGHEWVIHQVYYDASRSGSERLTLELMPKQEWDAMLRRYNGG